MVGGARSRGRSGPDAHRLGGVDDIHPDELTLASVPSRLERQGDPCARIDDDPRSLEPLITLHERDRQSGLLDAPRRPVNSKQPDEPPRVARSRARRDG